MIITAEFSFLGLLLGVAAIGVLVGVVFHIMKKGNEKFERMFAKVGAMDREILQNTDYQSYDAEPNCFVVLCVVAEVGEKKGKTELGLIYFKHEAQQFMGDSLLVENEVVQQKQIRVGSQISVVFKIKDEVVPVAWRVL